MRILVYGAGVLGSLYGVRLRIAGHAVVMLARGRRLADLRNFGLCLEKGATGQRIFARPDIIEALAPDDPYDLVIVPVRKTQLSSVLPPLAESRATPNVLFMVCNPSGPDEMAAALGRDRVLMGYAGAGGALIGPTVRYIRVSPLLQKTVLGEVDGGLTPRLKAIRRAFREAGFPTDVSPNIDAWLKTHVAWVSPFAQALYRADGDILRLAASADTLRLMARAIRESLRALRGLGIPATGPLWVRSQAYLPEAVLIFAWQTVLRTEMARISIAGHANAARAEMAQVAVEFRALASRAEIPLRALDRLSAAPEPEFPDLPRSR